MPEMIYLEDPDVTIWNADVLDALRELPDESVHMCCTSPPFYGLRDYGTGSWEGGDPDCDHLVPGGGPKQGLNSDGHNVKYEVSVKPQRDVCRRCGARRVDQQIGLEATPDEWVARLVEVFREVRRVLRSDGQLWIEVGDSYAANRSYQVPDGKHQAHDFGESNATKAPPGCKPKDLIGAPWLLAFALRADGWYLRSEIIWAKPNPMPESVTDRPTTAHSRVFLLTKSARYFYDAEAIREPNDPANVAHHDRYSRFEHNGKGSPDRVKAYHPQRHEALAAELLAGRNRRSVWTIATQPYPEAHFATWPEKLVEPMILAGCPEGGTVLDPFGGSGTTALVARKHGRKTILIELNPDYCALSSDRLSQQSLFA